MEPSERVIADMGSDHWPSVVQSLRVHMPPGIQALQPAVSGNHRDLRWLVILIFHQLVGASRPRHSEHIQDLPRMQQFDTRLVAGNACVPPVFLQLTIGGIQKFLESTLW